MDLQPLVFSWWAEVGEQGALLLPQENVISSKEPCPQPIAPGLLAVCPGDGVRDRAHAA